MNRNSIRI